MKFEISREWLLEKLAHCDDANAGAGGTPIELFKKDIEQRTVTPSVLMDVPTEFGKAVRYVREKRGWTRSELAELADIDEADIESIETKVDYDPKPRTVTQLADACHFSRDRFIQLAKHRSALAANENSVRYAAKSKGTDAVSDTEYEAVRALVEVLSKPGND
jgi:transcriptional regulator with XRE-family HTH domain